VLHIFMWRQQSGAMLHALANERPRGIPSVSSGMKRVCAPAWCRASSPPRS